MGAEEGEAGLRRPAKPVFDRTAIKMPPEKCKKRTPRNVKSHKLCSFVLKLAEMADFYMLEYRTPVF